MLCYCHTITSSRNHTRLRSPISCHCYFMKESGVVSSVQRADDLTGGSGRVLQADVVIDADLACRIYESCKSVAIVGEMTAMQSGLVCALSLHFAHCLVKPWQTTPWYIRSIFFEFSRRLVLEHLTVSRSRSHPVPMPFPSGFERLFFLDDHW